MERPLKDFADSIQFFGFVSFVVCILNGLIFFAINYNAEGVSHLLFMAILGFTIFLVSTLIGAAIICIFGGGES